jgi:alpha-tubulin suppressor-like RCC1 family protein
MDPTRPQDLIDAYLDQALSEKQKHELEQALVSSEEARRIFWEHVQMHAQLRDLLLPASGKHVVGAKLDTAITASPRATAPAGGGNIVLRPTHQWVRWLALAAALTICAGVWWFSSRPDASLELRVAEVKGKVSGFRFQGSEGMGVGVTELPSHQVAKAGKGMNAQRPSGEAGATLDTRHATLKVGDILRPGDEVEVGANGYAKLVYPDRTQVELQQNTRLRVTLGEGENTDAKRLALDDGRMVCSVAPQAKAFEIQTPQAVSRVVGTRFSLDVTETEFRLGVQEGKVALIQGEKSLLVSDGESAVATAMSMEMAPAPAGSGSKVYAWGGNWYGQLGNGTTNYIPYPVLVTGLDGVTAVAAGKSHTIALSGDGTVWTCGGNWYGQLGDGTKMNRSLPLQVKLPDGTPLREITAVAVGDGHTVALKRDGSVLVWGEKLAEGRDGGIQAVPTGLPGLSNVTAIAAGDYHAVALRSDNTVWAWGANDRGQLGDGTKTTRPAPVQVKLADGNPLSGIVALAAGGRGSVALRNDRTVWTWGNFGQNMHSIGRLVGGTETLTPVQVQLTDGAPLNGITVIAAGDGHAVALRSDTTVWAWGANNRCQLGDGTQTYRPAPVQVKAADGNPLSGITAIAAAGRVMTLAIRDDRTVWMWGSRASSERQGVPEQVKLADGRPLRGVTAIAAAELNTVAIVGEAEESVGVSE